MKPINIVPTLVKVKDTFIVKLAVYIGKKRSYVSTGIRVKPDQWDAEKRIVKKNHPLASTYNTNISILKNKIEKKLIDQQNDGITITVSSIRSKPQSNNLVEYFERLIEVQENKFSRETIENWNREKRRLQLFDSSADFASITNEWLRRYESYLIGSGLSQNTVHKSWKILRKVFLSAKRDKLTTDDPFTGYKNPQYIQTDRTYLLIEEVERIREAMAKPMHDKMRVVGYYFLLGCYSGLRYSDWQRFNKDFVRGDRLILRAKKNGKLISMQMHNRLKEVVDIVLTLPPVQSEPTVNEHLKGLAEICSIGKNLTTHVARHSFAVRCAELNISKEVTAELMGISVRTVSVYYKITNRNIDSELSKWND